MSKLKKDEKKVETPEAKKPTLSPEETKKLQGELNAIELEIIKNIFDPIKILALNKKKDETLTKMGRDPKAPWKK